MAITFIEEKEILNLPETENTRQTKLSPGSWRNNETVGRIVTCFMYLRHSNIVLNMIRYLLNMFLEQMTCYLIEQMLKRAIGPRQS